MLRIWSSVGISYLSKQEGLWALMVSIVSSKFANKSGGENQKNHEDTQEKPSKETKSDIEDRVEKKDFKDPITKHRKRYEFFPKKLIFVYFLVW